MGRRTDEALTVPLAKEHLANQRYREAYAESPTPADGCKTDRRQVDGENGRQLWRHRLTAQ
ncbi:hypothetical protein [Mucilaginibacter gracilis]|uniref:hypothetical protein n=1 Tax=Mucilaginibacter gracilis TaxID=423350 RepID=UPI0011C40ACE|nr:hypothetical protein [Mucilaginibacter gracilis]